MTRWLVRFGYDGRAFAGWARQPGLRTVEGELLRATARYRVRGTAIQVASRTDRGVSARANALVLESPLPGDPLLRALNGAAPEIFCTAAVAVGPAFRVRRAERRVYRYYEEAPTGELADWRAAARRFHGTIDARSVGRAVSVAGPCWRTVDGVSVSPLPGGLLIEVRAPSFVWGMVRKIVAALREHAAGRLSLERLEAALRGDLRLTLPMAEPGPLTLWEVEYPIRWEHRWSGPNRHQVAYRRSVDAELWSRALLRATWDPVDDDPVPARRAGTLPAEGSP